MSWTTTYERLRKIAARQIGYIRAGASADDEEAVNETPNADQHAVALERLWPSLIKDLSLMLTIGQEYVLLPADFEQFLRDDGLHYPDGSGYRSPVFVGLDEIRRLRTAVATSGEVRFVALGSTDPATQQRRLELWPTPDTAWVWKGSYRRSPAVMTAGSDAPDLPVALHAALRTRTRIEVYEAFTQEPPGGLLAEYARRIAQAADVLLVAAPNHAGPLRDVVQRYERGLEPGENRVLHGSYPWI